MRLCSLRRETHRRPSRHRLPGDTTQQAAEDFYPGSAVIPERHVKVFKNGRNQAVRIPREFEVPGEEAILRKGRRPAHH